MKKTRVFWICVIGIVLLFGAILFLGRDVYAAIENAYSDRAGVSVWMNGTDDQKTLCSQTIETDEVAVQMEVVDVTKDIEGLNRRYRLDVSLWNKGDTQYQYHVKLNGVSDSLITDQDDTEITCGDNYSSGESGSRNTDSYEFIPAEKQQEEGFAGELGRPIYQNQPPPAIGTISVTVTTYLPYFDLEIHSFTQELSFLIIEP